MTRLCYACRHQWAPAPRAARSCPACGNVRCAEIGAARTLYGAGLERMPAEYGERLLAAEAESAGEDLGVDKRAVF